MNVRACFPDELIAAAKALGGEENAGGAIDFSPPLPVGASVYGLSKLSPENSSEVDFGGAVFTHNNDKAHLIAFVPDGRVRGVDENLQRCDRPVILVRRRGVWSKSGEEVLLEPAQTASGVTRGTTFESYGDLGRSPGCSTAFVLQNTAEAGWKCIHTKGYSASDRNELYLLHNAEYYLRQAVGWIKLLAAEADPDAFPFTQHPKMRALLIDTQKVLALSLAHEQKVPRVI